MKTSAIVLRILGCIFSLLLFEGAIPVMVEDPIGISVFLVLVVLGLTVLCFWGGGRIEKYKNLKAWGIASIIVGVLFYIGYIANVLIGIRSNPYGGYYIIIGAYLLISNRHKSKQG